MVPCLIWGCFPSLWLGRHCCLHHLFPVVVVPFVLLMFVAVGPAPRRIRRLIVCVLGVVLLLALV